MNLNNDESLSDSCEIQIGKMVFSSTMGYFSEVFTTAIWKCKSRLLNRLIVRIECLKETQ